MLLVFVVITSLFVFSFFYNLNKSEEKPEDKDFYWDENGYRCSDAHNPLTKLPSHDKINR